MKPSSSNAKLMSKEILYDHYKDTFTHIRDREKQRNRSFFIVVAIIGLLFIEVGYPESLTQLLGEADASPIKLSLRAIPLPALLSATWTFLVLVVLQYCQTSVHIERQYHYLHAVEEELSSIYGGGVIFRREGKGYSDSYPLLMWWAWFFYTLMFPAIIMVTVLTLVVLEGSALNEPRYYFWYNCVSSIAILTSLVLYRFSPLLFRLWRKKRKTTSHL